MKTKKHDRYCYRCGISEKEIRKKGYYIGCGGRGKWYGKHLFKINGEEKILPTTPQDKGHKLTNS